MQQYDSKTIACRRILDPEVGSKDQKVFFSVMLHIKLKGMEHRAPYKHLSLHAPSAPGVGSKGQNIFFF